MTDAISIEELQAQQTSLQEIFEVAQAKYHDSKVACDTVETDLLKFNAKYGRVLQMMRED